MIAGTAVTSDPILKWDTIAPSVMTVNTAAAHGTSGRTRMAIAQTGGTYIELE